MTVWSWIISLIYLFISQIDTYSLPDISSILKRPSDYNSHQLMSMCPWSRQTYRKRGANIWAGTQRARTNGVRPNPGEHWKPRVITLTQIYKSRQDLQKKDLGTQQKGEVAEHWVLVEKSFTSGSLVLGAMWRSTWECQQEEIAKYTCTLVGRDVKLELTEDLRNKKT